MVESHLPLEGVKCVGVIMFQQVPVAFSMLADLGAQVIKVEIPGIGELGRRVDRTVGTISPYFETNNRGFKSVTIDLKKKKGLDILYKLVKDADIFAENFRPGVAERNHFGYEDLKKINPGIIYLSSLAYGLVGPNAMLSGTDLVAQAVGGIASLFGEEGSPMTLGQHSVADETGAMVNAFAIMVGLYHKKMTGEGQKIETSLLGSMVRLMGYSMTRVLLTNTELPRSRARILGGDVPYFNASFGDKNGKWFAFSVFGEEAWQKGINAIDFNSRVAEGESTKLSDISKSEEKKQLLLDNLDKHFATNTREHWVKALRSADVVCAPVNTVLDTSKDADVIANKYVIEVDHPSAGKLKEVGFPWKFSRFTPKAGIAPELGEHNQVILRGLGYSDSDIAQLKKEQVI